MTKTEKILLFCVAIIGIAVGGLYLGKTNVSSGNVFTHPNAYSSGVVYTSSTLLGGVPTSILPRATSSRTFAKICNDVSPTSTVFLYKQTTSTGVVLNYGTPIYPVAYSSSTYTPRNCAIYDWNDPYTGQVWGLTNGSGTIISVESVQE